jgi:5-methyltetrahydrofolate--homocysteine methyltransferase
MLLPLPLPRRTVLDGGMGTALIARGLDPRIDPPEAWNLSRPETVREIHRRFVAAGCQAIHSNTFGGNRVRLRAVGREPELAAYNRAGVELARAEAGGAVVIGSIGPTGLVPPPEGDADLIELEDAFAEQAQLLVGAGARALHLETFGHPKELRAALRGARAGAPGVPVIGSFTCLAAIGSGRVGDPILRTPAGFSPDAMIQVLIEEAADGAGVNCSVGPNDMIALVARLAGRVDVPIVARPIAAPQGSAPLLPDEFAREAVDLFTVGAALVGGCCGTGPADLGALRAAIG